MKRLLPFLSIALMAVSCIQDPESPMNLPDAPVLSVDETSVTRVSMLVNGSFGKNMTDITAYGVEISETLFEAGKTYKTLTPQVTGSSFSLGVTDLKSNNTYFLRAFIGNGHSKMYSSTITQQTPETSVASISDVTVRDNFLVATIEDNGGRSIEEVGFMWGTSSERKDLKREKRYPGTLSADGKTFTLPLAGVGQGTHYVLAYAEDDRDGTGYSRIPFKWEEEEENPPIHSDKYLTFSSEGTTTISLTNFGNNAPVLYYSTDAINWVQWDYSTLTITANKQLYMYGDNPDGFSHSSSKCSQIVSEGDPFRISGNIMTLLDKDSSPTALPSDFCFFNMFAGVKNIKAAPSLPATTLTTCCYMQMFMDCESLETAPELPAKYLTSGCYFNMFRGCASLTACPELPATSLADGCYSAMFYECGSLITAPALPATSLTETCYNCMFFGCSSLKEAPALPAVIMAKECYAQMFSGCSSLTAAPALPATKLAPGCYFAMFINCTGITAPPELPATQMEDECYYGMFDGCSGLTSAPALPATSLARGCYRTMFWGCSKITEAPQLPATTLAPACYYRMFRSCRYLTEAPDLAAPVLADSCYLEMFSRSSVLNKVKCLAEDISATDCVTGWLDGVAASGIFVKSAQMNDWPTGASGIPEGWSVENEGSSGISASKYLTFTSEGTTTISIQNVGSNAPVVYYSYDAKNWTQWDYSGLVLTANTPLYICGDNANGFSKWGGTWQTSYSYFYATGDLFSVAGDIMSLLDKSGAITTIPEVEYCFYKLFSDCVLLSTPPSLPSTELRSSCYASMFEGCTALTTAPQLPSTTLEPGCYSSMFEGCTNLSEAPSLPSTELRSSCYASMFEGCTALTTAPQLPSTTLAPYCYSSMFEGCANLSEAPALPATVLEYGCYEKMFKDCTSLVSAPDLPATEEHGSSYSEMFRGCSSLKEVGDLRLNIAGDGSCRCMFSDCVSLKIAPRLPATSVGEKCYSGMFSGCTALIQAPDLPATEMRRYCYLEMFLGCTSLIEAPELPATLLDVGCYRQMFESCSNLTTVPAVLPAITLQNECYACMFLNCSSLTSSPVLPATELVSGCYTRMFEGCSMLNYINCSAMEPMYSYYIDEWMKGVSSSGTFIKSPDMHNWRSGQNGIPYGWEVLNDDGSFPITGKRYLTFISEGLTTISLMSGTDGYTISTPPMLFYSTDALTWTRWDLRESLSFTNNTPLFICGDNFGGFSVSSRNFQFFHSSGDLFSIDGDIMSLINCEDSITSIPRGSDCFYRLFQGVTNLVSAPSLPATELNDYCYFGMFSECTSLISAPELPAITLANNCYQYMFENCKSLTSAPDLPASSLSRGCYDHMFLGCESLDYIKCQANDISEDYCVFQWLNGVAPNGVFIKSPDMSAWPTGESGIPEGWTVVDAQ